MFLVTVTALVIGSGVGYFVQHTFSSLRHDKKWPDVPAWKKRALSLSGSISALSAGLLVLMQASGSPSEETLIRMWFWQIGAAGGGATAFDVIYEKFRGKGGSE